MHRIASEGIPHSQLDGTTTLLSTSTGSTTVSAGAPVTFFAQTTSVSGITPTGSYTFTLDGFSVGNVPLDGSGTASFTLTLSAGTHTVGVNYLPTISFASSSTFLNITAVEPTTTLAATSFASVRDITAVAAGSGLNDAGAGPASYVGGFWHQGIGHVGYQNLNAEQQESFQGPDGQAEAARILANAATGPRDFRGPDGQAARILANAATGPRDFRGPDGHAGERAEVARVTSDE